VIILIAAGGTGGHIFPALAIARALQRKGQGIQVEFVGTGERMEVEWFQSAGYSLHEVKIRGLKGKGLSALMGSLAILPQAFWQSWSILSKVRPDVAVGVGGYASGPVLLLSALRGIPTLIHEENAFPGLTNRLLAPFVSQIAYSFPESERYFLARGKKAAFTGTPVRREILDGKREEAVARFDLNPRRFTLLSFGGSQGSSKINRSLLEALPHLLPLQGQIQFLHASGEKDLVAMRESFMRSGFVARIYPFIQDMASAYAMADLVISRAGASTIAELAALGKPSLLVPYPYAANDHQRRNAEALVRLGGGRIILDQDLDGLSLSKAIRELLEDPRAMEEMAESAKSMALIDADDRIASLTVKLAGHS
jgi:UDP-N-acetylglucosamine--N-acetylmuramyl-(pentapeptide) pyrophosphoryl-undecaprenol N-acetylglucosamine transferase